MNQSIRKVGKPFPDLGVPIELFPQSSSRLTDGAVIDAPNQSSDLRLRCFAEAVQQFHQHGSLQGIPSAPADLLNPFACQARKTLDEFRRLETPL